MKKTIIATIVLVIGLLPLTANAAIISVAGPDSNFGTSPAIISAPENVLNSEAYNSGMEGFDEVQGKVTTVAHTVDGSSVIAAGTLVSSHMIFLNKEDFFPGTLKHGPVVWTFDGPVVGVMSDRGGNLEAASTFELGAPGTNYPAVTFSNRGMRGGEQGDSYNVIDNQITVTMWVGQPGDWIRVITLAPILAPIDVEVDIKPGSCPNPFNPKSKGSVPVAIVGIETLDGEDLADLIDPTDICLLIGTTNVYALDGYEIVDSTEPSDSEPFDCYDCFDADDPANFNCDLDGDLVDDAYCGDGIPDLVLKFDTQELAEAIATEFPDAVRDYCIEVILAGQTLDGRDIAGADSIVLKIKK